MQLTDSALGARNESPTTPIVITEFDRRRLVSLLELFRARAAGDMPLLDALEAELERADVVDPHDVPPDVVTMNSTVEVVDLDTKETRGLTVVFPGNADASAGRVSVLAPVGLALFGARAGDEITWPTPARERRLRVERVSYQPESAGDFHL